MATNLTDKEIEEVPCIICSACEGQKCQENGFNLIGGHHKERIECRQKMPVLPKEIPSLLTSTDKSITTYYAFVMLCNAVAANSKKMFDGKVFTSQEIQRKFGKAGFDAAMKDGMIGKSANRHQRRAIAKKQKSIIIQ
jgi:hypothetical protein